MQSYCILTVVADAFLSVVFKFVIPLSVFIAYEQSKAVGKKSLLRTLQTLGSVPDWKSDERQQGSDSDGDSAVTPSTSKRKKKRRKRQKLLNTIGQQQENGELQETPKEEKIPSKKRKKGFNLGEQFTGSLLHYYYYLVLMFKGVFKSFIGLNFLL